MVELAGTIKVISKVLRDFLIAEEYAYKEGFLQGVDQKVKLFGIFLLIVLAISTESVYFFLFLFLFSLIMVLLSKVSLKMYLPRFGFIPLFTFIIVFPWIFLMPGQSVLTFIGLNVSKPGIAYVTTFTLRVTACVSCISLLLFTTRVSDLLHTLKSLKIPDPLVDIFGLVYRYLFSFLSELERMLLGRECRVVSDQGLLKNWSDGGKVVGNFLARTFSHGENVYKAMTARGYDGSFKTYPRNGKIEEKSIVFMAFVMIMVGIWLVTRL
jgi:cobalt/nickel transport system permease protein